MTNISGVPTFPGFNTSAYDAVDPATGKPPPTGSGALSGNGQAPDVGMAFSMGAVMGSIAALMPTISGQQLDVMLIEISTKMKDAIDSSEKGRIETDKDKQRAAIGEKKAKLEEAEKKIQEAIDKRNSMSVWDKIKGAFQMLGALIMVAVGILLAALTPILGPAAAIAGGFMIAGGIAMAILAIDSIVAAATRGGDGAAAGMGIAGHFAALFTDDKELLGKIDMGFKISLAIIGAVCGIVGGIASGQIHASVMSMIGLVNAISQGVLSVATGIGDAVTGAQRFEATKLEAQAKDNQAEAKELDAVLKGLEEAIDAALKRLMGAGDRFAQMLDSIAEAAQDRADTLARATFSAR